MYRTNKCIEKCYDKGFALGNSCLTCSDFNLPLQLKKVGRVVRGFGFGNTAYYTLYAESKKAGPEVINFFHAQLS